MKKSENKFWKILPIIGLAIVLVIVIVNIKKKKTENTLENSQTVNSVAEEFVENIESDTKLNNSEKLKETKEFDGLEIADIQITEKEGVTLLLANITNKTDEVKGDYPILITILDKDGNTITVAHGYIKQLQPNETTQLSSSKTFDYANAYDFTISKE